MSNNKDDEENGFQNNPANYNETHGLNEEPVQDSFEGSQGNGNETNQEKLSAEEILGPASRKTSMLNKNTILITIIVAAVALFAVVQFMPTAKFNSKKKDDGPVSYSKPNVRKLVGEQELPASIQISELGNEKTSETSNRNPYSGKAADLTVKNTTVERKQDSGQYTSTYSANDVAQQELVSAKRSKLFSSSEDSTEKDSSSSSSQSYNPLSMVSAPTNPFSTGNTNPSSLSGVAGLTPGSIPVNQAQSVAQNYKTANDQTGKKEFGSSQTSGVTTGTSQGFDKTRILDPGTIITGVLITGLNTDLPGPILAKVTENVYDSATGKRILIPQGSKLIAEYNSDVTWGQSRVQIAWSKIIRPDGYTIDLGNFPGVDSRGRSGQGGAVDYHLLNYAGGLAAVLVSNLVTGQIQASTGYINSGLTDLLSTTHSYVSDISSEFVSRSMDIQPTIRVNEGTEVKIFVTNTLDLVPYN